MARAKDSLNAGKKVLLKRLKAVRIADREEFGWAVLRHYESDEVASDTEDEKEISRGRWAAAAEVEKQRETASARSQNSGDLWPNRHRPTNIPHHDLLTGTKKLCFACGKEGHMQKTCYRKNRKF